LAAVSGAYRYLDLPDSFFWQAVAFNFGTA
jgi:hypothetical protein